MLIVVLQAEDRRFGLVVDDILDTQEIVVMPLSSQLENVAVYAGTTILGDGSAALILDVLALAQRAHVLSAGRELARGAAGLVDDGEVDRARRWGQALGELVAARPADASG